MSARRTVPRPAALPTSVFDDPSRRAALDRHAAEVIGLAGRVVDELLHEAADPEHDLSERRALVALAVEVDRQAAMRVGVVPATVEVAARGRAAVEVNP